MDDALLVSRRDRLGRSEHVAHQLPPGSPGGRIGGDLCEGLAAHQPHGVERAAVWQPPDVVHGDDARVIEPARDRGLPRESSRRPRVRSELRLQLLEGDIPPEGGVPGRVNDAHPPATEQRAQRIPALDVRAV